MSQEEKEDIGEIIRKIAPLRQYGHGTELFMDVIRPNEAESWDDYYAADLYYNISRSGFLEDFPEISRAKSLAVSVLEEQGLKYEELENIYLYRVESGGILGGKWKQTKKGIGKALMDRSLEIEISKGSEIDFEKASLWKTKYPWRSAMPIKYLWINGYIEVYTPEWHAIRVLAHCNYLEDEPISDWAMQTAITVGRSYESLLKKPVELIATRSLEIAEVNRENSARGGDVMRARAQRARDEITRVCLGSAELSRWITKGPKQQVAHIRRVALALDKDRSPEERLYVSGKERPFALAWFTSRLDDWRASGELDRAFRIIGKG